RRRGGRSSAAAGRRRGWGGGWGGGTFWGRRGGGGRPPGTSFTRGGVLGPSGAGRPSGRRGGGGAAAKRRPLCLARRWGGRHPARAHRVAERLDAGTVWVNCWLLRDLRTPFGGVKDSGVGREGGDEALRFFTDPKTVCVKFPAEAP